MSVVEGEGIRAADLLPLGEQLAQFPEPPIERQAEPLLFQPELARDVLTLLANLRIDVPTELDHLIRGLGIEGPVSPIDRP